MENGDNNIQERSEYNFFCIQYLYKFLHLRDSQNSPLCMFRIDHLSCCRYRVDHKPRGFQGPNTCYDHCIDKLE